MCIRDRIYYVSRYYDSKSILDKNVAVDSIKTSTVSQGYIDLYPAKDLDIILKDGQNPSVKYNIKDDVKAPIKKGQELGEAIVTYGDEEYKVNLVSHVDLDEASLFSRIIRASQDAANFLLKLVIAR